MSSAREFREMLKDLKIRANTDLGQNFLLDEGILRGMVDLASVGKEDLVIEVGAGPGLLTYLLAQRAGRVVAIEIDPRFRPIWERTILKLPNVEVLLEDACGVDMRAIELRAASMGYHLKVVSNLPYHISTPIAWKMLEELEGCELMLLTVQEEFARRLGARAGSRERCPLGVAMELLGELKLLRKIPPGAFTPSPSVSSRLVLFKPTPSRTFDLRALKGLLRVGFSARRKKLLNALSSSFPEELAEEALGLCGIPEGSRAEDLTGRDWLCLLERLGHG